MKRILAVTVVIFSLILLSGCGNNPDADGLSFALEEKLSELDAEVLQTLEIVDLELESTVDGSRARIRFSGSFKLKEPLYEEVGRLSQETVASTMGQKAAEEMSGIMEEVQESIRRMEEISAALNEGNNERLKEWAKTKGDDLLTPPIVWKVAREPSQTVSFRGTTRAEQFGNSWEYEITDETIVAIASALMEWADYQSASELQGSENFLADQDDIGEYGDKVISFYEVMVSHAESLLEEQEAALTEFKKTLSGNFAPGRVWKGDVESGDNETPFSMVITSYDGNELSGEGKLRNMTYQSLARDVEFQIEMISSSEAALSLESTASAAVRGGGQIVGNERSLDYQLNLKESTATGKAEWSTTVTMDLLSEPESQSLSKELKEKERTIFDAVQAGSFYKGRAISPNGESLRLILEFAEFEPTLNILRAYLSDASDQRSRREFTGYLQAETASSTGHEIFLQTSDSAKTGYGNSGWFRRGGYRIGLSPDNGRLIGQSLGSNWDIILEPYSEEERKALERVREEAREELMAATAPGKIYSGIWTYEGGSPSHRIQIRFGKREQDQSIVKAEVIDPETGEARSYKGKFNFRSVSQSGESAIDLHIVERKRSFQTDVPIVGTGRDVKLALKYHDGELKANTRSSSYYLNRGEALLFPENGAMTGYGGTPAGLPPGGQDSTRSARDSSGTLTPPVRERSLQDLPSRPGAFVKAADGDNWRQLPESKAKADLVGTFLSIGEQRVFFPGKSSGFDTAQREIILRGAPCTPSDIELYVLEVDQSKDRRILPSVKETIDGKTFLVGKDSHKRYINARLVAADTILVQLPNDLAPGEYSLSALSKGEWDSSWNLAFTLK